MQTATPSPPLPPLMLLLLPSPGRRRRRQNRQSCMQINWIVETSAIVFACTFNSRLLHSSH
jgi:hypothetical protein